MNRTVLTISVLAILALASAPVQAQVCPTDYSLCSSGVCCSNAAQCCPTAAEGCCAFATPYCCGDGTCAIAPDQCAGADGGASSCGDYDVPCGIGCIPAGSDCCSDAGRFCLPGSTCQSSETCGPQVGDAAPQAAFHVRPPDDAGTEAGTDASNASGQGGTDGGGTAAAVSEVSPLGDPANAGRRSCSVSSKAPHVDGWAGLGLLGFFVAALRRQRRRPKKLR